MIDLKSLKEAIKHLLNEDENKRKSLLKEDNNLLRSFLRHCIHEVMLEIKSVNNKEQIIRDTIRSIISEAEATGGSPSAPSDITAINFLKNLLKNIIPNIEEDYKELTSSKTQRISFRKHMLNATENLLNNLDADPDAMDDKEKDLEELKIAVKDEPSIEDDKFIDIYDDKDEPEEKLSDEEEFARGLEDRDLDKTGRNASFESFKKVKNQIQNEYSKLDPDALVDGKDETEREIFRDYLLLNMKLYFDKFEEDLDPNPEEPVTPAEEEYIMTAKKRVED